MYISLYKLKIKQRIKPVRITATAGTLFERLLHNYLATCGPKNIRMKTKLNYYKNFIKYFSSIFLNSY